MKMEYLILEGFLIGININEILKGRLNIKLIMPLLIYFLILMKKEKIKKNLMNIQVKVILYNLSESIFEMTQNYYKISMYIYNNYKKLFSISIIISLITPYNSMINTINNIVIIIIIIIVLLRKEIGNTKFIEKQIKYLIISLMAKYLVSSIGFNVYELDINLYFSIILINLIILISNIVKEVQKLNYE